MWHYPIHQPGCIVGISPHVGLIWKQEFAATSERPAPVLIIASTASPRFRLGRVRRRGGSGGYIFRPKIPKRPEKSGRPWGDSAKHPRGKIFPRTPFAPDKTLFFRLATIFTSYKSVGFCRTAEAVRSNRCATPLCRRDIPGPDFIPKNRGGEVFFSVRTAGPVGCTAHSLRSLPLNPVF